MADQLEAVFKIGDKVSIPALEATGEVTGLMFDGSEVWQYYLRWTDTQGQVLMQWFPESSLEKGQDEA